MVKGDWQSLVGREIEAVVVRAHPNGEPRVQVHLVFTDGNTFEIYSQCGGDLAGNTHLYGASLPEVLSHSTTDAETEVFTRALSGNGATPSHPDAARPDVCAVDT